MNPVEVSFRDYFHYDTVGGQEVFVGFFVEFDSEKNEFIFAAGRQLCLVKVHDQRKQNSLKRYLNIRNSVYKLVYAENHPLEIKDLATDMVIFHSQPTN